MGNNAKGFEFKKFATPRIIGGIAIVVIVLWALSIIFSSPEPTSLSSPEGPTSESSAARQHESVAATASADTAEHAAPAVHGTTRGGDRPAAHGTADSHATATLDASGMERHGATTDTSGHGATGGSDTPAAHGTADSHATATHDASAAEGHGAANQGTTTVQGTAGSNGATAVHQTAAHDTSAKAAGTTPAQQPATHQQPLAAKDPNTQASGHGAASPAASKPSTTTGHPIAATAVGAAAHKPKPKGVAFVEAIIKPLHFELEERWWGWRPNDIIDFTDNVNNFQMGALEVTRRATVALAERISRTGTTDAFDENLEQAMNWFMIKASSFWFPSAESKYREGLEELQAYLEKLNQGNATFYTRTDNLIPLLASFEDLLGSCDENLVKQTNEDGTPLSTFDVDNYFFYTQGVASSMATILEAVHHDFLITLDSRNATELLHHAIVSCQRAAELDPWIILNRDYNSIFANHRANMAAPISHAYFYIRVLIKTLST